MRTCTAFQSFTYEITGNLKCVAFIAICQALAVVQNLFENAKFLMVCFAFSLVLSLMIVYTHCLSFSLTLSPYHFSSVAILFFFHSQTLHFDLTHSRNTFFTTHLIMHHSLLSSKRKFLFTSLLQLLASFLSIEFSLCLLHNIHNST